jgi:hypothetical protein
MTCEICGRKRRTRKSFVWLTSFGVRKKEIRDMCDECIELENRGEL